MYDDSFWHVFKQEHLKNALTATSKTLAKIVKRNVGGNTEIIVKVFQKDGEMVRYKDNTGL